MRTNIKVQLVAVFLIFAVMFSGCGRNAVFKNPNAAVDAYKNGTNIVGMTIAVKTDKDKDIVEFDNRLGIIYDESYNGSFLENVCIFVNNGGPWEANKTYVVRVTNIRYHSHGYFIDSDIVE